MSVITSLKSNPYKFDIRWFPFAYRQVNEECERKFLYPNTTSDLFSKTISQSLGISEVASSRSASNISTWKVVRNFEPYFIALALPPFALEWRLVFKVVFTRLASKTAMESSELPSSMKITSVTNSWGSFSKSATSCERYLASLKNGMMTVNEDTQLAYAPEGDFIEYDLL